MPKTSKKTITATDTANTNVFLIADCSFRGFIAPVHRKGPEPRRVGDPGSPKLLGAGTSHRPFCSANLVGEVAAEVTSRLLGPGVLTVEEPTWCEVINLPF